MEGQPKTRDLLFRIFSGGSSRTGKLSQFMLAARFAENGRMLERVD
jgi:hypothetical protein